MVISEPSAIVQQTITLIGLERLFRLFPTDREALRYFGHDDDGLGGIGSRLKPRQPSGMGSALPEDESPDLDAST